MRVRPIYLPIAYLLVAMALESNAIAQVAFDRDLTHIRNIALLPPRIDVYELGLGGVREKIDDWSARAVANVTSAIDVELKNLSNITGVVIQEDDLLPEQKIDLEELDAFYDLVRASFVRHVFGLKDEYFKEKRTNFDYSLGKETAQLKLPGEADAFLVVRGFDQISSAARNALNATAMVAAVAMGAIYVPPIGFPRLNIALVDAKSGDILWFATTRGGAEIDLREKSSSTRLVKALFLKFPVGTASDVETPSKLQED